MDKELKNYMSNVDECIALFKDKVTRLEKEKQAAEQRAERAERALRHIATFNKTSEMENQSNDGIDTAYDLMIEQAREALTPKQASDEKS